MFHSCSIHECENSKLCLRPPNLPFVCLFFPHLKGKVLILQHGVGLSVIWELVIESQGKPFHIPWSAHLFSLRTTELLTSVAQAMEFFFLPLSN